MKGLSDKKFQGVDWASNKNETVTGSLVLRDRKTLATPDPGVNENGYVLCLDTGDGFVTIVDPDTLTLIED